MKHLTQQTFELILEAGASRKALEKGCRNASKVYARTVIELAEQKSTEAKNLPDKYTVLYRTAENLSGSNKRFSDWYTSFNTFIANGCTRRETDVYFVFESENTKKMIKKDKIIAFIW